MRVGTVKNDHVEELLASAKKKGYITQEEILQKFPKPEHFLDELDYLYDQLIKKEVDIFETIEQEKETHKSIEDLEKELTWEEKQKIKSAEKHFKAIDADFAIAIKKDLSDLI